VGWSAHAGGLGLPAVLLWGAGIAWTLFYDTIYAHQDKDDDAMIGVKSTARLFGANSRPWLRGFVLAAVLALTAAVVLALPATASGWQMGLALAGVWAFGAHLAWQLGQLDPDDPANCLRVFRTNRDAGLILALFLAVTVLV